MRSCSIYLYGVCAVAVYTCMVYAQLQYIPVWCMRSCSIYLYGVCAVVVYTCMVHAQFQYIPVWCMRSCSIYLYGVCAVAVYTCMVCAWDYLKSLCSPYRKWLCSSLSFTAAWERWWVKPRFSYNGTSWFSDRATSPCILPLANRNRQLSNAGVIMGMATRQSAAHKGSKGLLIQEILDSRDSLVTFLNPNHFEKFRVFGV